MGIEVKNRTRNTILFGLLAFAMVLATLSLARWQWGRAHTKQALQQAALQQGKIPALQVSALIPKSLSQFRMIQISGYWLPQQTLFLENQVYNGQVGYHVVMLFKTLGGELLLVDRGWLRKTFDHGPVWKETDLSQQSIELELVKWPPERPLLQQGITIQGLSRQELQTAWGVPLHSALWRDRSTRDNGLVRSWPMIGEDEINKHLSYAGQWVLFALMIFGAYGFYVWKHWFRPS